MEADTHSINFKIILFGTGTWRPETEHFGASTLIEAGIEKLSFK